MPVAFIFISVPSEEEAREIAYQLMSAKLIAAYNMWEVDSCYFWQGTMQNDNEVMLLCKTLPTKWNDVVAVTQKVHPYEKPCIAKSMVEVSPAYYDWMKEVLAA